VLTYNNSIQVFPGVLLAGMFNFVKREFFETDASQREAPTVDFTPTTPSTDGPSVEAPAPAAPAEGDSEPGATA
jgi:hypothetical protein